MRSLLVAGCVAALCTPLSAAARSAQPAPSPTPIVLPTLPPNTPPNPYVKMGIDALNSLLRGAAERAANNARGQVTYFKRFELQIRTGSNAYRDVHLHQGTIINPRGTTLALGQTVTVSGVARSDGSLDANEITVIE